MALSQKGPFRLEKIVCKTSLSDIKWRVHHTLDSHERFPYTFRRQMNVRLTYDFDATSVQRSYYILDAG